MVKLRFENRKSETLQQIITDYGVKTLSKIEDNGKTFYSVRMSLNLDSYGAVLFNLRVKPSKTKSLYREFNLYEFAEYAFVNQDPISLKLQLHDHIYLTLEDVL